MELEHEDRKIGEEDFLEWMQHPITQSYFREVNSKVKEMLLFLGEGKTINPENTDYSIQQTNKMIGKIEGLREILDIELIKE